MIFTTAKDLIHKIAAAAGKPLVESVAHAATEYLDKFGYLQDVSTDNELDARIKYAQTILGVDDDGVVGPITAKAMMVLPRCGLPDVQPAVAQRNQWLLSKAQIGLRYSVISYAQGGGLTPQNIEDILIQAWSNWEHVCGIRLIRASSQGAADIIVDSSADPKEEFGTAGNVLAWAQLPQGPSFAGKLLMKFDRAETWSKDSSVRGILMLNVATHEFGHLLGLDHTQINGELMYPIYDVNVSKPQARYDIPETVARYGAVTPTTPPSGGGGGSIPPVTPTADDLAKLVTVNVAGKTFKLVA